MGQGDKSRFSSWFSYQKGRFLEHFYRGWYIKGDADSENRKRLVKFNLTSNIMANLVGGNFFTGLLLAMEADDSFIGLITIIIFSCNLLQLFSPYVLERFEKRKRLLITLRIIINFLNIVLVGLVPLVPGAIKTRFAIMAALQILINGLNAFMAPGFTVWHIAHVPQKARVPYFSLVTLLNGTFVAIFNLLAARAVDLFKTQGVEFTGLMALRGLAVLVAVLDFRLLRKIDEKPRANDHHKISLRELFTSPWKDKIYMRTVLISFLWQAVANLPGSYYSVYLLRDLQISYSYIMSVSLLNVIVLSATIPIWRRIYTRRNWLLPLSVAIMLHSVHYFILAMVTKSTVYLYPIGVIWAFCCQAGFNLGFANLAYINLPEENQSLYLGFYSTISNVGALVAVNISRRVVIGLADSNTILFNQSFSGKQLLMIIVGCLIFFMGLTVNFVYRWNKKQGRQV